MGLSGDDWQIALTTLRDHSLLAAADPREPETLDAHPLVRACFADELESHRPGTPFSALPSTTSLWAAPILVWP